MRLLRPIVMTTLSAALAATAAAGADPELAGPERFRPESTKHRLAEAAAERARLATSGALAKSWAPTPAPSSIDVRRYTLDLALDMGSRRLSGTATVELAAVEDALGEVVLDMDLGLRPLSVVLLSDHRFPHDGPRALAWNHADDRLTAAMPRPLAAGDVVELSIAYGGTASRFGYGVNWASWNGTPMGYTFAEPFGARVWFPCNDRPDDKALVDLRVTVPDWATTASNGLLVEQVVNEDGSISSTWSSRYPVATYLVVLNVGPFVQLRHDYTAADGTAMPVHTYVFPEAADLADAALGSTPDMIATLAPLFGEYPFLEEKYGNCVTFFGGGMEHQTLTTYSLDALDSDWAPWLNVHELGHQWWGDWVTCEDFKELWLNEGFATLTEWLWAEHLGADVLARYLEDADWRGWFLGPLYDNPVAFSSTVYDKGAWALRMLRHVLGDDPFFAGVAEYRTRHAGGSATTGNLRVAFEAASGEDLEWFFDQWVYGANRPRLQYEWQATPGPGIRLTVTQEQTNAGFFRLPMEVDVATVAGVERHRVDLPAMAETVVELDLQASATGVTLDPDNWVLADISPAADPDLELGPDFPGPYDAGVVLGGRTATVTIPLTNTGGSPLEVAVLEANAGTAWSVLAPEVPFEIAPGQTVAAELEFAPAGAGAQDDYLVIVSDDPSRSGLVVVPLTGTGALSAGPRLATLASATLGTAPVGGTAERTVQVSNFGDEPLTLEGSLEGDGFALAGALPAAVAPGGTEYLFFRFHPTRTGGHSGSLTLTTNDPARPEHVIALSGSGAASPRVALLPEARHLGLGAPPAPASILVANRGELPLTVSAVAVDGPFELAAPLGLPATVPASGTLEIPVRTRPGADGELRGALRVRTDDPSLTWAVAPLSARVLDRPPVRSSVPAAASSGGLGGARWTTDATLLNPGDSDLAVDLRFLPGGQRSDDAADLAVTVPAGGQRQLTDVVGAMGEDGAGGVELLAEAVGLVTVTRTFSREAGGTYGQHIGGLTDDQLLTAADTAVLAGLAGNDGFHTNLGILNLAEHPVRVRFTLYAADGTRLGEAELTAIAGGYAQEVSVLAALTAETVRGGWAEITTGDPGARYAAWASVVDDGSHDPTFISPVRAPVVDQVIPAVAAVEGLGGTVWASDVTLVNIGTAPADVTLAFVPGGAPGSSAHTRRLVVDPRSARHLENVVADLAGAHGEGVLRITATAPGAGVVATSRTYTSGAAGTYGQLVPAVPVGDVVGAGERVVVAGLRSTDGFRSNLGLTSLADVETTVTARFFDDLGAPIGVLPVVLPAGAFVQEVRVLERVLGHVGTAWVELSSDDDGAAFVAHASVVDGTSGDPAYIPAARVGS